MHTLLRTPVIALALGLSMQVPAHAAGGFPFALTVTPNPIPHDMAVATVVVTTLPHALCTAHVLYAEKRQQPVSFHAALIGDSGGARWTWHLAPRATNGAAFASCTYHGVTETLQQTFTVARA